MNLTLIKNLIPFVFVVIIVGFIAKLGADNADLKNRNIKLREQALQLNSKNDDLAATLKNLAERVGEQNAIVQKEATRRAAAEMKQQRLQDEVKQALRANTCSVVVVPDDAANKLRTEADSVRSGKSSTSPNSSKPAY